MVPTHQELAAIAYRFWQERGCPEGDPDTDWFHAVVESSVSEVHAMVERVLRGEVLDIYLADQHSVAGIQMEGDDVKAVEVANTKAMDRKPKPDTSIVQKEPTVLTDEQDRFWMLTEPSVGRTPTMEAVEIE